MTRSSQPVTAFSPYRLRLAARTLRAGGVIAYPTEAVFGLGCDPLNRDAVMRLLHIKQRPVAKGLILIASEFAQLRPYVQTPDAALQRRLEADWPGPVTWLLAARAETPRWLRGTHDSIAVRVTAHRGAAALCDAFGGALVSTSANLRARPPARSALQVRRRCPGVDLILNGPTDGRRRPSEIRDARNGELIRPG